MGEMAMIDYGQGESVWSLGTLTIFGCFLKSTAAPQHGYALANATSLNPNNVYQALRRLEDGGLIISRRERDRIDNRPPRRLYTITEEGLRYGHMLRRVLGTAA